MGLRLARAALVVLGTLVCVPALATHIAQTASQAAGQALWQTGNGNGLGACAGPCHSATPPQMQRNGAGKLPSAGGIGSSVLNHVFPTAMEFCDYAQSLLDNAAPNNERQKVADYLWWLVDTPKSAQVAHNGFVDINVNDKVNPGGYAFSHVAVGSGPASGSLTHPVNGTSNTFNGTVIRYTPTGSFTGSVSFTFRGRDTRAPANVFGEVHTVNIMVGEVPNITSSATPSATIGTAATYNFTHSPATLLTWSITSGGIPTGMTQNATSITGIPTDRGGTGTFTFNLRAANGNGTDNLSVTYTILKGNPVISFANAQADQTFQPSPSNTFAINPVATFTNATANAQILPTYTSITPTICTTPGTTSTTVTIVSAGLCQVQASYAGNNNWNAAAVSPIRNINIVKKSQTITFPAASSPSVPWSPGGSFVISPVATTDAAAQPGIAIAYGVTAGSSTVCSVPDSSVASVNILTAGSCVITANEDGNTNYSAAAQKTQAVTITAVQPSAPTIGVATPGDTTASIAFTASATNGGSPLTTPGQYTATCTAGGQPTRTANAQASPITVTGLANTVTYSCVVTATNQAGLTSPDSAPVDVTPQPTPVPPSFNSANSTTFTFGIGGTFNVTATGVPTPTISITAAPNGLPAGVTFSGPGTSPVTLSGTPEPGSVGTYPLTFLADGTNPDVTQDFVLTVAKRAQTVSMVDPPDSLFGTGNVALSATATSGLPVTFSSLTDTICGISGSSATLLNVGTCTIQATQPSGNADWEPSTPAAGDTQSFTISAGPQTIDFGTQVPATRVIAPGQNFTLNPPATAVPSGLAVSYSTSTTPGVCTPVGGTSIRMDNVGTCTIVASQTGNAQYQPAAPVQQNVTLTIASPIVTFPNQPAQPYVLNGTFGIVNPASSDSGLPVAYTSDTMGVCTVTGTTVTIVTVGTCTLRATQAATNNYTSASATANVDIQAVEPKAPTIGLVPGGNQHAKVNFTAPADNGGTAITGYVATCGAVTANGTTSPITVTGLTNNQVYACSVAAVNAVGTGASSGTVDVTPNLMGATLWADNCTTSGCHTSPPSGARFNYAGSSPSTQVLDYVIATNPVMNIASLNALNSLERRDLKAYISGFLAAIGDSTRPGLPKTINVGGHLSLNTVFEGGAPGSFSHMVIDTLPANGTLSANGVVLTAGSAVNGVEVVYIPNAGYTGPDSFTYHGQRNIPTVVTGDTQTVTITVSAAARLLTVSKVGTGTGYVFSDTPTSGIDCGSDCTEAYNNNTVVALVAVADAGTTFIGWSGGGCSGNSVVCNVTMSAAQTVTATFDLTPFDLTVSRNGAGTGTVTSAPGGINCGATCTVGFPPSTVVTLTPTPAAGSAFTGWSGACSGTGACIVTMDAAKSVIATFQPTYVLAVAKAGLGTGSVASTPSGINCGATCNAEFVTGTVVSLTPTPAAGSAFTGWSGDCSGTGACSVTMTAAHSVTANFTPTYTLTVSKIGNGNGTVTSNPAGISACAGTCTADYLDTTVVNLTATIGADTDFLGWGGACSGTGACSVTMSAARTVTANFKSSIALTVTHAGSGSGVVTSEPEGIGISCGASCTAGFDPGTIVTLGRSPAAGSIFAGWSGACTGTGACVLTMSQSRSVTATFNVAGGPQADVAIASHTSDPPAAASVGQQVTYALTVANNGPAGATNVTLTDALPTGATFVSASAGCSHNAGTVTCALGALASGASVQVQIVVQPTVAGSATNFASVSAAETDPLSFNNAAALAITVSAAANLGRLSNISTRMQVLSGDDVMIGGFVIGGSSSKTVVVRARGPSLAAQAVPGVLANPQLQLFSGQTSIATNDDWGSASNAAAIAASGFAPSDANEAAILMTLAPGAYTAIVSGVGGTTGVAIIEVFEVDAILVPLANISTRGRVQTGDNVLIGGFVIQGDGPQTVVIRARGPSLAQFGIQGLLANPQLQLFSGATQVAANNDWQQAANAAELQASGFAPGDPREAAILITLQPGAYTAIVSGVAGGTGIAIVEVFRN